MVWCTIGHPPILVWTTAPVCFTVYTLFLILPFAVAGKRDSQKDNKRYCLVHGSRSHNLHFECHKCVSDVVVGFLRDTSEVRSVGRVVGFCVPDPGQKPLYPLRHTVA